MVSDGILGTPSDPKPKRGGKGNIKGVMMQNMNFIYLSHKGFLKDL